MTRFTFSLKTLVIANVTICLVLAFIAHKALTIRRESVAIKTFCAGGNSVGFSREYELVQGNASQSIIDRMIASLFGREMLHVQVVRVSTSLSTEQIDSLSRFSRLQEVVFNSTQVQPMVIDAISTLDLKHVAFHKTAIPDESLESLSRVCTLESMSIAFSSTEQIERLLLATHDLQGIALQYCKVDLDVLLPNIDASVNYISFRNSQLTGSGNCESLENLKTVVLKSCDVSADTISKIASTASIETLDLRDVRCGEISSMDFVDSIKSQVDHLITDTPICHESPPQKKGKGSNVNVR